MRVFYLNRQPDDLPEAMADATRLGIAHCKDGVPKLRSTRAVSDQISPYCTNGHATALKQAYNAGYWSASLSLPRGIKNV